MKRPAETTSVKTTMLVSFLLVLAVPLFLGMGGYWWAGRLVRAQATRSYQDLLGQAQVSVEGMFSEIEDMTKALDAALWVQKIAYMDGPSIDNTRLSRYDLSLLPSTVADLKAMNRFIDRVAIVFNQKNLVITDTTRDDVDWFFAHAWTTAEMSPAAWTRLVNTWTGGLVLRPMDVLNYKRSIRTLTYIKTLPLSDQTPRVTLVVAIRDDTIAELFSNVTALPGASAFITDASGTVITSYAHDPALVARVAARSWPAGHMESVADAGGRMFFAFRARSATTGRSYTAIIPQATVMSGVTVIKYVTLGLFLVSLAIGLLIAWSQWRRTYRPLEGVVDRLRTSAGSAGPGRGEPAQDEYAFIEAVVAGFVTSTNDLQSKVDRYLPMAVHSFFIRLLYGVMGAEQREQIGRSLGLESGAGPWTVAVVYNAPRPGAAALEEQRSWQRSLPGGRPLYVVQVDASRSALILGTHERSEIEEALRRVENALDVNGDGQVLAGVGTPCDSLACLPTSYREALTVLNNAVFAQATAGDGPLYFEDLGRDGLSSLTLPEEREGELLTRTRMGDFAAVSSLLDELLARATGSVAGSFVAMQSFFYALLSTALKAAEGTGLPLSALVDERRIMELGSAREMKEYLLPLYRTICDSMAWQREGHALRARAEILQYIDDNCLDNGISLRTIASRFGVSVPYLSRFIKDQTSENFVEYVARRRIAKAKEMLAAGTATIEQVSQRVGYINPLTFRRAFKKYEGVNPGDYRGSVSRGRSAAERPAQPTLRI